MKRLRNNNGAVALIMMAMSVSAIFCYYAYSILSNSQNQVSRAIQMEAQQNIVDRLKNFLRSPLILNYAFNQYNLPNTNTALKNCIVAGDPLAGNICKSVNINFYQPTATGAQKFSGGRTSPAYFDKFGMSCTATDAAASNCYFQAITECNFSCPGGQSACALTKIMSCDIEISAVHLSSFRLYIFSKKTKQFVSNYTVRMNNDMSSWNVVRF